jgi:predicted cupin superfamily sugar epimerase
MTANEIVQLLRLEQHPKEGGYFRETYRSRATIDTTHLPPAGYANAGPRDRALGTAIYYLITPDSFSALHRLPGEEVFHHYLGDAVEMLMLHADGRGDVVRIGTDLATGESPQVVVPGGTWQGSRLVPGGAFALLGCTMSPGFDYADYAHGRRNDLIERFPAHAERIRELTPHGS